MATGFTHMLEAQLELQKQHMKDGDPRELEGEAFKQFMCWNAYALEDEVHEATNEVPWKPWASSETRNRKAFMGEMVDAFHFFMNMMLAASPGMEPSEIAAEFEEMYFAKNRLNARRQQEGYTGSKCPICHRALEEASLRPGPTDQVRYLCPCGHRYQIGD